MQQYGLCDQGDEQNVCEKDCKISTLTEDFELSNTVSDNEQPLAMLSLKNNSKVLSSYSKSNSNCNNSKFKNDSTVPQSAFKPKKFSETSSYFGVLKEIQNIDHNETQQKDEKSNTKNKSPYSGLKNCNSMKEIMEELSKIVEGSNQKDEVVFNVEDLTSESHKNKLVFKSDTSK